MENECRSKRALTPDHEEDDEPRDVECDSQEHSSSSSAVVSSVMRDIARPKRISTRSHSGLAVVGQITSFFHVAPPMPLRQERESHDENGRRFTGPVCESVVSGNNCILLEGGFDIVINGHGCVVIGDFQGTINGDYCTITGDAVRTTVNGSHLRVHGSFDGHDYGSNNQRIIRDGFGMKSLPLTEDEEPHFVQLVLLLPRLPRTSQGRSSPSA
jgi:hypothetical protein